MLRRIPFPKLGSKSTSGKQSAKSTGPLQTIYVCGFGLDNFELAAGVKHGAVHRRIRYEHGGDVLKFDLFESEDHVLLVKQLEQVTDISGRSSSKVLWVDGRVFTDPACDRKLNNHVGSHPATLRSIQRNCNTDAIARCAAEFMQMRLDDKSSGIEWRSPAEADTTGR